jgi:alcohol dehydrogenase (cytochrome c)
VERTRLGFQEQYLVLVSVDWCEIFKKTARPPQFALNVHYYYGGSVTRPMPAIKRRAGCTPSMLGRERCAWRQQWPTPLVAALTATSGGLLCTGDLDNNFLDRRS